MSSAYYANPYAAKTFFPFLWELVYRLWGYLSGQIPFSHIASDEIQIIALLGVSLSCALVGSFLILRKMTMLANSLSHTILLGIVLAFFFTNSFSTDEGSTGKFNMQAMLAASLLMGFMTTFLTQALSKHGRLQEDASTGIVFTTLFALGIILVTVLSRDAHIGIEAVMGNVDALQIEDCKLVYIVLAINVLIFGIFYKEFQLTTFDPAFAIAMGFSVTLFNYLLMAQVSITTISAFRAVGVLMVLAFITGPPLTARLLTHDLKKMLLLACGFGSIASILGVALSRHILTAYGIALTTGGIVVCVIVIFYAAVATFHLSRDKRATPSEGTLSSLCSKGSLPT